MTQSHTRIIGAFVVTLAVFFSHQAQAVSNNFDGCFKELSDRFQWPLGPTMASDCSKAVTAFGPMMSKCIKPGDYSFSRSITYSGNVGDSVYAVFDGTVVKAGYYFPDIDEYNLQTIIVKHDFPQEKECLHENEKVKSFFTIYGHVLTNQTNNVVVGQTVTAGEIIGSIGYCNKCKEKNLGKKNKMKANLLYQVRLDVHTCPDLGRKCGKYGSPVHPQRALPSVVTNDSKNYGIDWINKGDRSSKDLLFTIIAPSCWKNDIIKYLIECFPDGDGGYGEERYLTLDLETRKGFGTMPDIYQQKKTQPHVQPELNPFFVEGNRKWKTNLVVPISWCPLYDNRSLVLRIGVEGMSSQESQYFWTPYPAVASQDDEMQSYYYTGE